MVEIRPCKALPAHADNVQGLLGHLQRDNAQTATEFYAMAPPPCGSFQNVLPFFAPNAEIPKFQVFVCDAAAAVHQFPMFSASSCSNCCKFKCFCAILQPSCVSFQGLMPLLAQKPQIVRLLRESSNS